MAEFNFLRGRHEQLLISDYSKSIYKMLFLPVKQKDLFLLNFGMALEGGKIIPTCLINRCQSQAGKSGLMAKQQKELVLIRRTR